MEWDDGFWLYVWKTNNKNEKSQNRQMDEWMNDRECKKEKIEHIVELRLDL